MNRRVFEPLPPDHPAVGRECATCGRAFEAGDRTTTVNPRPADAEAAEKHARGDVYLAQVDLAHAGCAEPADDR